jgi:hypothetical protein
MLARRRNTPVVQATCRRNRSRPTADGSHMSRLVRTKVKTSRISNAFPKGAVLGKARCVGTAAGNALPCGHWVIRTLARLRVGQRRGEHPPLVCGTASLPCRRSHRNPRLECHVGRLARGDGSTQPAERPAIGEALGKSVSRSWTGHCGRAPRERTNACALARHRRTGKQSTLPP